MSTMTYLEKAERDLAAARAALPKWDDLPTSPDVLERLIDAKINMAFATMISGLSERK